MGDVLKVEYNDPPKIPRKLRGVIFLTPQNGDRVSLKSKRKTTQFWGILGS